MLLRRACCTLDSPCSAGPPLLLVGLTAWGCAERTEAADWKTQTSAIQGGEIDGDDRAAVGIVVHLATQQITCSGALIAPSVVATARHCVAAPPVGPVVCGQSPIGDTYPVAAIDVTTTLTSDNSLPSDGGASWGEGDSRGAGGDDVCGFDLALIVLSDVVGAEEAKPFVPRFEPELRAGEGYAAIGFGATCGDLVNNERCRIESGARRRIDGLAVQCAGGGCADAGIAPVSEWLGDRGLCEGDSGDLRLMSMVR